MGQRRHHYEHGFERYLRDSRIPYISVNEAKKSLLPQGAVLSTRAAGEEGKNDHETPKKLKNFDFVVYGEGTNLLVEVKGRRLAAIRLKDGTPAKPRLESWVTLDDIEALSKWRGLFGPEFEAVFVFVYWCDDVPPDGLFVETFVDGDRWYTLRAITLDDYVGAMKVRSPRWRTMNLSAGDFEALSTSFCVNGIANGGGSRGAGGHVGGYVREPIFDRIVGVEQMANT
ncbi:MAG: HYExAFE family protein [Phycisphaerales bacterium]|nr:HYExAFE family protein [Phycisphaerales bacterium]